VRVVWNRLIILFQSSPHFASLDANHRVVSRGVARWTQENFSSDGPFLELLRVAFQLMLNDKLEKLPAPRGISEEGAAENLLHLQKNRFPHFVISIGWEAGIWLILRQFNRCFHGSPKRYHASAPQEASYQNALCLFSRRDAPKVQTPPTAQGATQSTRIAPRGAVSSEGKRRKIETGNLVK
jgi:hypothetical protein